MYTVECDGVVLYNDTSLLDDVILITPNLDLEDNTAGQFTATIPPSNRGYNVCKKMSSTLKVKKNGEYLWSGRIVQENEDFYGRKAITCEGALAFLNDSILTPKEYSAPTIASALDKLLAFHNSRVNADRRIYLGAVTVTREDGQTKYQTNYESTFSYLQSTFVDVFGGHMMITERNDKLYLNYYADYSHSGISAQTIDFGVNLLDFAKNYDFTNICTVCIPRGKQLDSGDAESEDQNDKIAKYVTVESVNKNSIYVKNDTAVSTYGPIERIVDFSDVEDPFELLKLANIYMRNLQFDALILSIKAVDMHMLNPDIPSFNWMDSVHCISLPHGLDKTFPISAVSIPLDHPENMEYTLGRTDTPSMSGVIATGESNTAQQLSNVPSRESVLTTARNVTTQLLNKKTKGYVNIIDQGEHSEALVISNYPIWSESPYYWKWDMNGLGYFEAGENKGIAITKDGQIVADFITAGKLDANIIKTGVIKDIYNNNSINLATGEVNLNATYTTVAYPDGHGGSKIDNLADLVTVVTDTGEQLTVHEYYSELKTTLVSITSRVGNVEARYATCSTAGYIQKKSAECENFKLIKGATVVVVFEHANTVENPLLSVNGSEYKEITYGGIKLDKTRKHLYWGDNQTVHFVYTGTCWSMTNSATESRIYQLASSISLSVTNGSLGHKAEIKLSVNDSVDTVAVDMTGVRKAFKNDNSKITISAGLVRFDSGTFILNSGNCTIDENGTITATNVKLSGTMESKGTYTTCSVTSGGMYVLSNKNSATLGYVTGSYRNAPYNDKYLQIHATDKLELVARDIILYSPSNDDFYNVHMSRREYHIDDYTIVTYGPFIVEFERY